MAELGFCCTGVTADRYAVGPTLSFRLAATETSGVRVHAIALRVQLRIEPGRRRYDAIESARLEGLFGEPGRWADTLRPLQFAQVSIMVPGFTGHTEFDLPVPCSYDLEVAGSSYLHALAEGDVPFLLLFSGSIFTAEGDGFSVQPVSWRAEASYRMPVVTWREMMDRYFPASGWIRLHRDTLDALGAFKNERALPTWDQVVSTLIEEARCHER